MLEALEENDETKDMVDLVKYLFYLVTKDDTFKQDNFTISKWLTSSNMNIVISGELTMAHIYTASWEETTQLALYAFLGQGTPPAGKIRNGQMSEDGQYYFTYNDGMSYKGLNNAPFGMPMFITSTNTIRTSSEFKEIEGLTYAQMKEKLGDTIELVGNDLYYNKSYGKIKIGYYHNVESFANVGIDVKEYKLGTEGQSILLNQGNQIFINSINATIATICDIYSEFNLTDEQLTVLVDCYHNIGSSTGKGVFVEAFKEYLRTGNLDRILAYRTSGGNSVITNTYSKDTKRAYSRYVLLTEGRYIDREGNEIEKIDFQSIGGGSATNTGDDTSLGYTQTYTSSRGRTFKLYQQGWGSYANQKYNATGYTDTIANVGCCPSSMAIILSGYGINADPGDVAKKMMAHGQETEAHSSYSYATMVFKEYGLNATGHRSGTVNYNDIKTHLQSGGELIISTNGSNTDGTFFTRPKVGHLIAVLDIRQNNGVDEVYVGNSAENRSVSPARISGWYTLQQVVNAGSGKWWVAVSR